MTTKILRASIREVFERWIDAALERILAVEDYLCLPQNVRASEISLLALGWLWFFWFLFFDVEASSPVFEYIFSEKIWAVVFGAFASLHFSGIFLNFQQLRQIAVFGHAVIWAIWTMIVVYSRHTSTAAPTLFVLLMLAIYVASRLAREEEEAGSKNG